MEIVPGLHQLQVPIPDNPLENVLPYLVRDGDGCLLVDSGWNTPKSFAALRRQLDELGVGLAGVRRLVMTHVHPDHFGLAGRVKEASGAEVLMHEREQYFIQTRYHHPEELLKRMASWLLLHGVPREEIGDLQFSSMAVRSFVVPAEPDTLLRGSEVLEAGAFRFEVIWTPGHSPGHICLYERSKKLLLTGDHVLPTITPNVSLHPEQTGNPLGDFLASLRALKGLEVEKVLPAHEYTFDDLQGRLQEIEEHHGVRLGEMVDAVSDGRRTAYQVAGGVTWATGSFEEFSPWMRRAAIGETLAHLEYLVAGGHLEKGMDAGIAIYERRR